MLRRRSALVLSAPLAATLLLAPSASATADGAPVAGTTAAAAHLADHSAGHATEVARALPSALHRVRPNALPVIRGEVGPGFTISLSESSVPKGRYKFVIRDRSSSHNFHLTGRGVDESTTVPFVGKTVWKVALRPGSYRAQCDPHAASMNTSLQVTN